MEVDKIVYDEARDVLEVFFVSDAPIATTRDGQRGTTVDLDAEGNYVAMHVPDASGLLGDPADWLTPHILVTR
jgi:hypothetical protein